jgi:IS6 family transposase
VQTRSSCGILTGKPRRATVAVTQPHRRIKRLVRPGLGFGCFRTARRTLAGFEAFAMIRKGQIRNLGGRDIRAQAAFVASLFEIAA